MFSTSITFTNAIVLSHIGPIANSLRIESGKIVSLNEPLRKDDFVFDVSGGLILPGLVNAHDHLAMNNFGKLKYRDIYPNAHEWSLDIEARFDSDPAITVPRAAPMGDRLFIGGIKNLLAGVTTVCHHDPWHRSLGQRDFPVRVVKRFGYCHSIQRGDIPKSFRATPPGAPWIIHLAEGTDEASARELDTISDLGCFDSKTVVVHGVGLTAEQRCKMIDRGASLVWCPSSNQFLLGKTAQVQEMAQAGRVALGTDSRLTGERDIWYELRAARETGQLPARDLLRLITSDAAKILKLQSLGEIIPGALGDLLILPAPRGELFDDLLNFNRADARLALIGGKPRYGDPDFAEMFSCAHVAAERIHVDGREKLLARDIAQRLKRCSIKEAGVLVQ